MTFSLYGMTDFDVQYWNETKKDWETVSAGLITGNNLVWRRVRFPISPVTTSKIRVVVNPAAAAKDAVARIVEVEAWGKRPRFGG